MWQESPIKVKRSNIGNGEQMSDFQIGDIVTPSNCPVQNMLVTGYVDGRVFCSTTDKIWGGVNALNFINKQEIFYPENLTLVHRNDPTKPPDVYSNVSETESVDLTEMIKNQVFKCESLLPGSYPKDTKIESVEEVKQETWCDRPSLL